MAVGTVRGLVPLSLGLLILSAHEAAGGTSAVTVLLFTLEQEELFLCYVLAGTF